MEMEIEKTIVFFGQLTKSADGSTRLYYTDTATRADGKTKHINGAVIVEDKKLLNKLSKLKKKVAIEIEVETDWNAPKLKPVLVAFRQISVTQTEEIENEVVEEQELVAA